MLPDSYKTCLLSLSRRTAYQTLLNALDISSARPPVTPDLLKALAILPDTTVRTSAFNQRPKNILEARKKTSFPQVINKPIIYKFFKESEHLKGKDHKK